MIIKYEFADGTKSEVEVDDAIGTMILDSRREEENYNRKERYHGYSLDAIEYEGIEYADDSDICGDIIREEDSDFLYKAVRALPEIQRRRFLMNAMGMNTIEIAKREGVAQPVVYRSIEKAKNNLKKIFEEGV